MSSDPSVPRRIIIVSNRLPFTVTQEKGGLAFSESVGGVATGLRTYLASVTAGKGKPREHIWVGWPGNTFEPSVNDRVKSTALNDHQSCPVFLSSEDMELFYHGFCNKTIWPLFHYFPTYATFDDAHWKQYKAVNDAYCKTVLDIVREGDLIWVHDYHLMLLPGLLRARRRDIPIGFFLHIPFPSFEIFRLLPGSWRRELLEGMLGADQVGFHTYGYMQHFQQSVFRILGHESTMGLITTPTRVVKAETFPMGIDFRKFHGAVEDPEVLAERDALRASLPVGRVVLSVDRLDYTKGILNRLHGFERLLEENPVLLESVVLIMIVVPSRVAVDRYEQMKKETEELVGRINGRFGSIRWTPVVYQYRRLPFAPLVALYGVSDVALVTPLRDGMNLVAKEYIASRVTGSGVLIISEMAGAAKELGEAIVINPHDVQEIAGALKDALEMPLDEQRRRNGIMQRRLERCDVVRWADEFIGQLLAVRETQKRFDARVLQREGRHRLLEEFRSAQRRLFLLDYDGTLVPLAPRPQAAKPDRDLLALLNVLGREAKNSVVVISGRDRFTLQKWLGHLPVRLVAEHGIWVREYGGEWMLTKDQASGWKGHIMPILERYADRLPGAFVEEKEFSIVWHFRNAHPDQGRALAGELTDHLVAFTANIDLQVMQGKKVVEVRNAGVNKGVAAHYWLAREQFDFVFAAGDDWTDEDMFTALPESAWSVRVGITSSRARFNMHDSREVITLLKRMALLQDAQYSTPGSPVPDTFTRL
jgi:trehalose 6-phosphate synthase/phosphatase